jgi:hypothetical protein
MYTTVAMSRFDEFDRITTGARHIISCDADKTLCGVSIIGNTDNDYLDMLHRVDCKKCRSIMSKRQITEESAA